MKAAPIGIPTREPVSPETRELSGLSNYFIWGQYLEMEMEVKNAASSIPAISWQVRGTPMAPCTCVFILVPGRGSHLSD